MDDTQTTATVETPSTPVADTSVTSVGETAAASSTRPSSMRDALEQTAARHAAIDREAAPDAAAAALAPGEAIPAIKRGPIPFDVHDTALKNARTKAEQEVSAKFDAEYGWAKQVNQQELQDALKIANLATSDPIAYAQSLIQELQSHPVHGQQMRSLAAKALAAARGQHQAAEVQEPQPDLPIQLEDGRVVHLYSADQQTKREAFLQKQWLQSVQHELQPLKDSHQQLQADKAAMAKQHEIGQFVTTTYQDVTTWPGMDDKANQVKVAQALAKMSIQSDDPREVSLALNAAYRAEVLPSLSAKASAQASAQQMASLKQKAVAQVESPSRAATASATKPRTPAELAKFMAQRAAERGR